MEKISGKGMTEDGKPVTRCWTRIKEGKSIDPYMEALMKKQRKSAPTLFGWRKKIRTTRWNSRRIRGVHPVCRFCFPRQLQSGWNKYSTYVKYGNIYRIHMEGTLGSIPLSGMPGRQIQEKLSAHISQKRLSDSIQKSVSSVARQILKFADRKYSFCVPALNLSTARPGKRSVETFSKTEQSRLLACIYNDLDKYKIAVLFCMYTGTRLGELCSLKWADFDFGDRTVTVNRTVQRIMAEGYITKTVLMETAPKSESSKRTIPLTDEMIKLLKMRREDGDYVFGGNKPLEPRTMQYRLKKILKEAGVDDRNFHILRHTFATNCVESGMDVKTLSMILGHFDVKITLNRYVHPTMDSRRKQMDRLLDFHGQIRGQIT